MRDSSVKGLNIRPHASCQFLQVIKYLIAASLSGLIARLNLWDFVVVFTVILVLGWYSCHPSLASVGSNLQTFIAKSYWHLSLLPIRMHGLK